MPDDLVNKKTSIVIQPYGNNAAHFIRMNERAFQTYGIDDDNEKAFLILSALPPHLQEDLGYILDDENAESKFKNLKDAILKTTEIPDRLRMRKLNDVVLGDRKPSALLRQMRELAGGENPDNPMIRSLFLERLPNRMVMIIAPEATQTLDSIASMADRIFTHMDPKEDQKICSVSFNPPQPIPTDFNAVYAEKFKTSINAIRTEQQSSSDQLSHQLSILNSNFNKLQLNLERIENKVERLQNQLERSQQRSRSQYSNNRTNSNNRNANSSGLCYFHLKFGSNATKCQAGCTWSDSNSNQGN